MKSVFDTGGYLGYVPNYNQVGKELPLISSGLVVNLDAGKTTSYPGSGSTWTNLGSGSTTYNASLSSVTYSSGSLVFNGSNSYGHISRPVQDDFTLYCWFKTSATGGTAAQWYNGLGLLDAEVGGVTNDYGTSMGAGKVMFGTGNSDVTITSPLTYNDNKWHCMTATRTKASGALTLYMDGASVATGTGSTNSLTAPSYVYIGMVNGGGYFNGNIAIAAVYNVVLSASQVAQNYQALRTRFGV